MFFTREALEQASDPLISRFRSGLIDPLADTGLIDTCCGIGTDSLAFARRGYIVMGLDSDPVRVEMARLNAAALGLSAQFAEVDVRSYPIDEDIVFFDPARRDSSGRRIAHVEHYQPPLSTVRAWRWRTLLVKLSPGVQLDQLAPYGGEITFISVGGDLKEAQLMLGEGCQPGLRAVMLRDGETWMAGQPLGATPDVPLGDPLGWLCEPDPAAIRAGLVRPLVEVIGGRLLDETIAYFTIEREPTSPWVRAWPIESWLPFSVKRLRDHLRMLGVGHVTVKKRGTAVTPDVLIPQLKLKGDGSRTLVLTRLRGQQIALICRDRPVPQSAEEQG
jgi:SAM-dependent methyltransferase